MRKILKALWQFVSYLFWPQWGKKMREEHTHDTKDAGQSH